MPNSWDKLGKLSIAILEGFVESKLGKNFVDLIREPTDKFIAISKALDDTENIIRETFEDKGLIKAIFDDLTINKKVLFHLVGKFFDHPTEPSFHNKLASVLAPELELFAHNQVIKFANQYVKILKEELSNVDEEFRSKINALSNLEIAQNTRRLVELNEQNVIEAATVVSSFSQSFIPDILPDPSNDLPKGCKILPQNIYFVNRETLLINMGNYLLGDKPELSRVAAITGTMRGVGKTQLALQFCYHYGKWFDGIHWIDAQQTIEAEIAGQGERMGLASFSEGSSLLTQTLKAWQEAPNRLIILDNVDKPDILQKWLSQLSNLKVLITTQYDIADKGVVPETAIFRVDELAEEYSIKLFKNLAPRLAQVSDDRIKVVAAKLGHLPLAIDMAGRYLKHREDLTLEKYMDLLNKASLDHSSLQDYFSQTDLSPTKHMPNLYDTFSLSWHELDEEGDFQAREIFMFAGYLAPNTIIPKALIYALLDTKKDEDQEKVDKSIDRLQQVGLLRRENVLHPLLSMFAQMQARNNNTLESLVEKMSLISDLILWNMGNSNNEENRVYNALKFEEIRQHLEAVASTAKASPTLNSRSLWLSLGDYYYLDAIEYSSAKNSYLFALDEEKTKNEGKGKDLIAELYNKIGRIHHILFENEEAKKCYLQSIEIWGDEYGKDHSGMSVFLSNLGDVYKDLREFGLAYHYVRQAYLIDNNEESYIDTARDLNKLGEILLAQHDLINARRLFSRSIEIYQQIEEFSYEYAQSACNLGEVLRQQGDLETAKNWLEYAIQVNKTVYNKKEHPDLANCIQCLGAVFRDENNIEGAKDSYNKALTIYQSYFSPEHPRVRRLVEALEQLDFV
jgi:hypothetical protein